MEDLEDAFIDDIASGRAGIVKIAGQYHTLGAHEERTFAAAAAAASETGVPICIHTELGTPR